jgi:phosphohistidine phosphatase SixA
MRHGEAGEAATDRARTLTTKGRAEAAAAGVGLLARGARIGKIVHSPYARASETASLVAAALGVSALSADERFEPEASVVSAKAALVGGADVDAATLVVAHMPILPRLVELLCGVRLPFPTAGVAELVKDGTTFRLVGLFPPDLPR